MGFIDRLNEAVSAVDGAASDFIGAAVDVAKFGGAATDAATSALKSVVATEVTGTPHVYAPKSGLSTAGDMLNAPLEYLVDRPLQTPANLIRDNIEHGKTGLAAFLPSGLDQVGQAYEEGAHQSAGQALGYLANSGPTGIAGSAFAGTALGPLGMLPSAAGAFTALHNGSLSRDVLGESAAGRAQLRNTDIAFNISSGTVDFFKALVLDPLNLVSGGAKAAKAAEKLPYNAKNMVRLTAALSGKGDGHMRQTLETANNALDNIRFEAIRKNGDLAAQKVQKVKNANTLFPSTVPALEHPVANADLGASTILEAMPAVKAANKPMELATALASTFRIADDGVRHQAYNDIWAAAAGDIGALRRVKAASEAAGAALDRASRNFNEGEFLGDAFEQGGVDAAGQGDNLAGALERVNMSWVQDMHKGELGRTAETLDTLQHSIAGSMHSAPLVDWRAAARHATGKRLNPFTKVRSTGVSDIAVDLPGIRTLQDSPSLPKVDVLAPIVPRMNRMAKILNAVPHEMRNKLPHGIIDMTDDVARYNEITNMLSFAGVHPQQVAREQSAMMSATSTLAQIQVAKHAEKLAVSALAQRHGVSLEDANKIWEQIDKVRTIQAGRLYSAAKLQGEAAQKFGEGVQFTHDVNGDLIAGVPPGETQQLNTLIGADLVSMDKIFRRHAKVFNAQSAWAERAAKAGMNVGDLGEYGTNLVLHNFNKVWKFQVLFRLGYPVRNMIDNDARMWAKIGAKATAQVIHNRMQVLGQGILRSNRGAAIEKRMAVDEAAATELQLRADKGVASKDELQELRVVKDRLRSPHNYLKLPGIQGERVTVNGVTAPAPFEGIEGGSFYQRNMGRRYTSQVNDMSSALFKSLDTHGSFELVKGGDPAYFDEWARVLNHEIAQDAGMKQVLAGKSPDQLKRWFNTASGRKYLRATGHERANLDEYAAQLHAHVLHYTPGPLRHGLADGGAVTPQQLEKAFPNLADRPDIHGQKGDILKGRGVGKTRLDLMDKAMQAIGDLPDDKLSRHPMFAAVYQDEMRRQLSMAGRDAKNILDGEDIADMARQARTRALRTVRDTLYDSDTYTNAARMMRFVSPFFAAWQEGITRWSGLLKDNPHPAWRAYQAWNAPNKAGLVVDQDGNPVEGPDLITTQDQLVLKVPNVIARNVPGWWNKSNMLYTGPQARISKSAFNLWLQGDPFYSPGVGPLVQIPMAEVVKHVPSLNDAYTTLIDGYGVPQNWYDPLEGSTLKRVVSAARGPDDQAFAQAFSLRFQDNMVKMNEGEIPHMSADELTQRTLSETRRLFMLRALSNSTLPFPPTPSSDFQFFRDRFQQLQAEQRADHPNDPEWATRQFMHDFGDAFFPLTQSVSKNNAGVQATASAVEAAQKYGQTIGLMRDPKMAASIIGSAGRSGTFNMAAYRAQQSMSITAGGTGAGNKYRSKMDPSEAATNLQQEEGWYKFTQMVADLNAMAVDRGGDSVTYRDYEDLTALYHTQVAAMSRDENGDYTPWYQQYMGNNPATYSGNVVHDMREVVRSSQTKNRADVKVLGQYLRERDWFTKTLQERDAMGGSAVMSAQSNADLAALYRRMVGNLVNKNTQFNLNWFIPWINSGDQYYIPAGGVY